MRLARPRFGYMRRKVRGAPGRTNLGKTVKTLREKRDLSQSMLAERARLTQPYLAQIERGVRTNPSLETLRSIARALRVSVNRLIR
jgi:transcriptional regulator with XRE-family HTH domain